MSFSNGEPDAGERIIQGRGKGVIVNLLAAIRGGQRGGNGTVAPLRYWLQNKYLSHDT